MVAFERRAAHSKALEEASLTISASDSEQDVWVHVAQRATEQRGREESSIGTQRAPMELIEGKGRSLENWRGGEKCTASRTWS